jgi:hypothetical protein
MKRFMVVINLLVVLSLTFGIVACGQTTAPTTQAPTTTAPTTTVAATTAAATTTPTTSKPATTTAPVTTSATATTAATPVAAKYILSLAPLSTVAPPPEGSNPPPAGSSLFYARYVNLVAEKTNGMVRIDPYWSQSLLPANQIVSGVSTGVADIGGVGQDKEAGKLPLSMVSLQPGFGTDW